MSLIRPIQPSFSGGEVSPSIYARVDIERYKSSLRTCRNFIIHPHGGTSNRPGTRFVEQTKYATTAASMVQEFIFSNEQKYVLEIGNTYIRFYTDGLRVENLGIPYEVTTPYSSSDLSLLRFESSADVIFITHPDYQTRTLTRYGDSNWALETYDPEDGPFMPENIDDGSSLTASATTGTITLTASATFTPDPSYAFLCHFNGANGSTDFIDEVGSTMTAAGSAQMITTDSVFGGACGDFDGIDSYVSFGDSDRLSFAASDFTIGFRVKLDVAQTNFIYSQNDNGGGSINKLEVYFDSGGDLNFVAAVSGSVKANYTFDTNLVVGTWYDIEITRSGTNLRCFKDGVSVSSSITVAISTNAMPNVNVNPEIGRQYGGSSYLNGKIDEMRILKGTAAHTSGFTSATSEFTFDGQAISGFAFSERHVGALFKLKHYIESQTVSTSFSSATTSSSIRCFTTWRIISHGTWTGKFRIEKSTDGGTTWTVLRTFSSANDFNANTSGTEDVELNTEPFLVRINMYSYTSGTANIDLTTDPFFQEGIVRVTAFNSVTSVTATVINDIGSTAATVSWAEGSWSAYRGYPSIARFFQDRLCFANTYSEPQTVWMSQTSNYYSFYRHTTLLDTDGITTSLPSRQVNAINGLIALTKLIVLTGASEWSIGPGQSGILTPTSIEQKVQGYRGSNGLNPVIIGNEAIYVQRNSSILRNVGYEFGSDSFTGTELNILAKHLFSNWQIVDLAYQQDPDSIIWALRNDGVLLGLTYLREQEVVAWHKHDTNGEIESICVVPDAEANFDELWMIVNRTNGRFVERMSLRLKGHTCVDGSAGTALQDQIFMDSSVSSNDTFLQITDITNTDPVVVTTATAHGFSNGDLVRIEGVVGMEGVNGQVYVVQNVTTYTFQIYSS